MYRIPADLDLHEIVGSELNQICSGKYDVQFAFLTDTVIAVQSEVTLLDAEEIVSTWDGDTGWTDLSFQKLLMVPVIRYAVPNDRLLQIEFENGLILQIHDNLDQYEAFQIYRKGFDEKTIVV